MALAAGYDMPLSEKVLLCAADSGKIMSRCDENGCAGGLGGGDGGGAAGDGGDGGAVGKGEGGEGSGGRGGGLGGGGGACGTSAGSAGGNLGDEPNRTANSRYGRKGWSPLASCAYGEALLPRKGKLRSAAPLPSASCVSTMTAMPAVSPSDGHPACGYTARWYSPSPALLAVASQLPPMPAVPLLAPLTKTGAPTVSVHPAVADALWKPISTRTVVRSLAGSLTSFKRRMVICRAPVECCETLALLTATSARKRYLLATASCR